MTIETFTKQQFEDALPIHNQTGEKLWSYRGLNYGEHWYSVRITDDIFIMISSSVDSSGYSQDVGENSIRCWLVDSEGRTLGSKIQKYTTREPGWSERLTNQLRELWRRAQLSGYCSKCGTPKGIFKCKKPGHNKGKLFSTCNNCKNEFKWLEPL